MTARIALRDLQPEDAQVFASWQTDAVLAAHAEWRLTSDAAVAEHRSLALDPNARVGR